MITVFTCSHDFTSMLTCIYDAWCSRLGHNNVRLCVEPVDQLNMFETYIHVEPDEAKASEVVRAVNEKISPYFYGELMYCAGAYEPDTLNTIYRVMVLGFKYGSQVLKMYQFPDVVRFLEISKRYGNEAHSFREFARFHMVGNIYVAHIEPKSHVLLPVAEYFIDRCPSESWIVVDDVHREAVIHPLNSPYYLKTLTPEESDRLMLTENANDEFTNLWQSYFDNIAIQARINYRCQLNHFPKWKRRHAVEFV